MDEWLSVEEVLPNSDGYEALVSMRRSTHMTCSDRQVTATAIWLDGRWVSVDPIGEVTHWLPLPDPPVLAD